MVTQNLNPLANSSNSFKVINYCKLLDYFSYNLGAMKNCTSTNSNSPFCIRLLPLLVLFMLPMAGYAQQWDYILEFKDYTKQDYSTSKESPKSSTIADKFRISISKNSRKVKVSSSSFDFEWYIDEVRMQYDQDGDPIFKFNQKGKCKMEIGIVEFLFTPGRYIQIVDRNHSNITYLINDFDRKSFALWLDLSKNKNKFFNSVTKTDPSNNNSVQTQSNTQPRAVFHGTRFVKLPGSEIEFGAQCNVTVFNAKGKKVSFTAFFDGATRGVGLKDYNGKYCTGDGHVCAPAGEFICNPEWEGTQWSMMTQTIPLSELHLADGNHTINVRWFAFVEGKIVGNSDYQTIHFTKNGNRVSNFFVEGGEATSGYFQ